MARKFIDEMDWIERGENLLYHGEFNQHGKAHKLAMDEIKDELPRLLTAIESNDRARIRYLVEKLNTVAKDVDKSVWDKWKGRIRSKKASTNTHRRDIPLESYKYLEGQTAGDGVQEVLDGLGKDYFLISKAEQAKLDFLDCLFDAKYKSAKYIESLLEDAFRNPRISNLAAFVHFVRGNELEYETVYKFGKQNKVNDKTATRLARLEPVTDGKDIFMVAPIFDK